MPHQGSTIKIKCKTGRRRTIIKQKFINDEQLGEIKSSTCKSPSSPKTQNQMGFPGQGISETQHHSREGPLLCTPQPYCDHGNFLEKVLIQTSYRLNRFILDKVVPRVSWFQTIRGILDYNKHFELAIERNWEAVEFLSNRSGVTSPYGSSQLISCGVFALTVISLPSSKAAPISVHLILGEFRCNQGMGNNTQVPSVTLVNELKLTMDTLSHCHLFVNQKQDQETTLNYEQYNLVQHTR